jgi:PIN domain nuclease of toxin-antitoxin system
MIVLDTHVWLWWINQDQQLKPAWRSLIEESTQIGISAISCFEVAWLAQHGRISLSCSLANWFDKALTGSGVTLLPITPQIASQCVALPEHHSDPQDRLIIATTLAHTAKLISADGKFPLYEELAGFLIG